MDMEKQTEMSKPKRLLSVCRKNLLVVLTVAGVVFGLAIGLIVRTTKPSDDAIMWIGLSGEVYMRMLKMMILPLIIATVITGTASLNPRSQGRVSAVSVTYIAVANFIPPIIGAVVVVIFQPGASGLKDQGGSGSGASQVMETQDIFADLIRNLFPDNLITAAFQQTITKYDEPGDITVNASSVALVKYLGVTKGTNVLGLIICCTLFGVATSSAGSLGKPFLAFFVSASEIILKILRWLIWFTPVGVASLIAKVLAKTTDIEETFRQLGLFILAAVLGLCILMFILIPLAFFLIIRRNPFRFFLNMLRPLMITFATASSAIAIPDTLYVMENHNGIDKRISRFVVPFSSALNKSGSALYIAACCIFVLQLEDVRTEAAKVIIVIILTALSTFAVPSVPSAGIVTVIILLTAMNIPTETVGLLLAIEWFLDRFRTAGNLYSQILCVAIVQKYANLAADSKEADIGVVDVVVESLDKKPEKHDANNDRFEDNAEEFHALVSPRTANGTTGSHCRQTGSDCN